VAGSGNFDKTKVPRNVAGSGNFDKKKRFSLVPAATGCWNIFLNFFPSQIAWKQKLFHKEYCVKKQKNQNYSQMA
jgi:hypothetical protein